MPPPVHPAQLRGLPSTWAAQVGDLLEEVYDRGVTPEEADEVWAGLVSRWAPVLLAGSEWLHVAHLEDQLRDAAALRGSVDRARRRLDRAAEADDGALDEDGVERRGGRDEAREDLRALAQAASGLGKLLAVEATLAAAWVRAVDRLRAVAAQRCDPAAVRRLIETGALQDRQWRDAIALLQRHDDADDPLALLAQLTARIEADE